MISKLYDQLGIERIDTKAVNTYKYLDYYFDVVCNLDEQLFEFWLYHKTCGIKEFVHGISMLDISYAEFLVSILSGIEEDIEFYDDKYNF